MKVFKLNPKFILGACCNKKKIILTNDLKNILFDYKIYTVCYMDENLGRMIYYKIVDTIPDSDYNETRVSIRYLKEINSHRVRYSIYLQSPSEDVKVMIKMIE